MNTKRFFTGIAILMALVAAARRSPAAPVSASSIDLRPIASNTYGLEPVQGQDQTRNPVVASDGDGYFVVWEDWPEVYNPADILGSFLSSSGAVLTKPSLRLGVGTSPSVVWNGTAYVVAWADSCSRWGEHGGARPDISIGAWFPGGEVAVAPRDVFTSNGCASDVQLLRTDFGYVLAWIGDGIRVMRLDATLAPVGEPATLGYGSALSMVHGENGPLLGWVSNDGSLQLTELNENGTVLDTLTGVAFNADRVKLSPAASGALILARLDGTIHSFLFDSETGTITSSAELTTVSSSFYEWAVLPRADGFILAMTPVDCTGGCKSNLVRVDLDPEGRLVRDSSLTNDDSLQNAVALGTNGSGELLLWGDDRLAQSDSSATNLFATTSFDAPLVAEPSMLVSKQIYGGQTSPLVTHNDSEFVVLWNQFLPEENRFSAYSRRVRLDGTFLDVPHRLNFGIGPYDQMWAAFNGSEFLVVFSVDQWNLFEVRLDPTGDPIGNVVSIGSGEMAAVATDGTDFFVVWVGGSSRPQVYGTEISADGQVVLEGGFAIFPDDADQSEPTIAWNGTSYVVVWLEQPFSAGDEVLRAVSLTTTGTTLHSNVVATSPSQVESPSLAWNGQDSLLVWASQAPGCCTWDTHGRFLSSSGDPEGGPSGDLLIASGATGEHSSWPPVNVAGAQDFWSVTWFDELSNQCVDEYRLVGRLLPAKPPTVSATGKFSSILGLPLWAGAQTASSSLLGNTRLSASQHQIDLGPYIGSLTDVLLHVDRARLHPARRP